MKRICILTTVQQSMETWITPMLPAYKANGIQVTLVCNMTEEYEQSLHARFPYVHTKSIDFPRGISFAGSVSSILHLIRFFRKERFDLVQYSTPNVSMYAAVAAYVARIPVRLYCQWGMVYTSMQGLKRFIFENIERMVCRLSSHIQPDSYGNLNFCRREGFYNESKSCVIWNGSAKGLDLSRFDIEQKADFRNKIREKYGICNSDLVIGFVGRLGRDKGCNELIQAFLLLKKEFTSLKFLFVGPIEKEDSIIPELLNVFHNHKDIIKCGRVSNVPEYISAMDVFVSPSYREGFGMGVIEASAMGIPVVATEYPGPSSAMIANETGLAVPVKAIHELADAIKTLLLDSDLREEMGRKGREFAESMFEQKEFINRLMENRIELLS